MKQARGSMPKIQNLLKMGVQALPSLLIGMETTISSNAHDQ